MLRNHLIFMSFERLCGSENAQRPEIATNMNRIESLCVSIHLGQRKHLFVWNVYNRIESGETEYERSNKKREKAAIVAAFE